MTPRSALAFADAATAPVAADRARVDPAELSVAIRDLRIAYGGPSVLDHLTLDIAKGEFVVLLGPSGCGKSTLLNAIAGLIGVDGGEIWISGREITDAAPKDRGIGMVFQSYALYPRMTVRENMGFGLKIAGLPKTEIADRVARAARLLKLEPLLERRPAALSGGQRQRVAIGRALVRNVDVFLFDEPLSNLDAQLRAELRVEIKKLHQDIGNTMIYVTHDQVEAMTLADRIAVMKGGVIQQLGSPRDIYDRPRNLFTAGFVGSPAMSFLEGRIVHRDGRPAVDLGEIVVPLDRYAFEAGAAPPPEGREVVLGIRPEHVATGTPASGDDRRLWTRGIVRLSEPTGADTTLWVDVGERRLTVRVGSDNTDGPNSRIDLALDLDRLSLFDAASGERL